METNKYLEAILASQTLKEGCGELKKLRARREEIETLIKNKFDKVVIRYGGSKAKETMILESYDLDLICYFHRNDTSAGGTIKEIKENVSKALTDAGYIVIPKGAALRVMSDSKVDFHVDVVPGRFVEGASGDAWIYQDGKPGDRLQTNLDKHIDHVKKSGLRDVIKMIKYWRGRNYLSAAKTFALELLTINILEGKASKPLSEKLEIVFTHLRDKSDSLSIKDPANGNNDVAELINSGVKGELKQAATQTLQAIDAGNWEFIFGSIPDKDQDKPALQGAISTSKPTIPYGQE